MQPLNNPLPAPPASSPFMRFGLFFGVVVYFFLNLATSYLEDTYLSNEDNPFKHTSTSLLKDYQPVLLAINRHS